MGKVQRRKNISVNPELYERVADAASRVGLPVSRFSEIVLRQAVGLPFVRRRKLGTATGFEWVWGTPAERAKPFEVARG